MNVLSLMLFSPVTFNISNFKKMFIKRLIGFGLRIMFETFLFLIRVEIIISSLYSAKVRRWRDGAFLNRTRLALS